MSVSLGHATMDISTDRPSSRVLAAPGGRSDMASILGGYSEPNAPVASKARAANPITNDDQTFGARVAVRNEHTGISDIPSSRVLAAPGGRSDMASIMSGGAEPTAPAPKTQVAPTATMAAPPAQLAAGQRVPIRTEHTGISEVSSSRVLAAPGGQSSMAAVMGGCDTAADRKAALMARRAQVGAPLGESTNVAAP